jgi:uncharacterized protein (TIGR03435 family)
MFLILRSVVVALLASWVAFGQSTAPLSFDVASIKPAAPCCAPGQWRESKAGEDRIDFRYVTLRYCVAFAWRLREYQVSGPSWLGEIRFDIVAKGPAGSRHDQLPDMMQQLLAERFQLQAHHETRAFPVFVLSVGNRGPRLKESPADPDRPDGANVGMSMSPNGIGRIEVKHGSMASLANTLTRIVGRPVVDLTRLTGVYDFDLEYAPEDGNATISTTEGGVSVFASIQKLGLKLEAATPPMDAIVVDRAQKIATEN